MTVNLLVIGGTGTLGRQIVRQALNEGYQVRCLVRNLRQANFLKDWGAELVYGDLTLSETIPPCLRGINIIIDASTTRANESIPIKKIDWNGKLALIEASKTAEIEHFIFCSLMNKTEHLQIPLMRMKKGIEIKLINSKIPYTIFRLPGFYQGLIEQYAISILENQSIWTTTENTCVSYINTQDVANFFVRSLKISNSKNKVFSLGGPKGWLSTEIIALCEKYIGQPAKIVKIPVFVLKLTQKFIGFFEFGQNIADRLAFVELFNREIDFSKSTSNISQIFNIDSSEMLSLEDYLQEYFTKMLLCLVDINFEAVQKQKNLII